MTEAKVPPDACPWCGGPSHQTLFKPINSNPTCPAIVNPFAVERAALVAKLARKGFAQ
jgi:hypothetical protein